MSIATLRQALRDVEGAHELVMRYEDGGNVQIFKIGNLSVKLGPHATPDEIRSAFAAERAKS